MEDNKKKALVAALTQIERQFGKGSVMRLGDAEITRDIEVISTGSLSLDIALGIGGLPRGRIVEIYGPESSGKTTLTLQVIAEVQRNGGTAAFVDAEHALDPGYAEKLGVNINDLLVSQPDTGEQALEITDMLVRSSAVDIVVVDSVGREVWHWSNGRMFTQGVQNKQLGTGDTMQVDEAWKPRVQSGHYTAIATLNSSNYPVEQRVDFVMQ